MEFDDIIKRWWKYIDDILQAVWQANERRMRELDADISRSANTQRNNIQRAISSGDMRDMRIASQIVSSACREQARLSLRSAKKEQWESLARSVDEAQIAHEKNDREAIAKRIDTMKESLHTLRKAPQAASYPELIGEISTRAVSKGALSKTEGIHEEEYIVTSVHEMKGTSR